MGDWAKNCLQCGENCNFRVSKNVYRKKAFFWENFFQIFLIWLQKLWSKVAGFPWKKSAGLSKFISCVQKNILRRNFQKSSSFFKIFGNLDQIYQIIQYNFSTGLFKVDLTCLLGQVGRFCVVFFVYFVVHCSIRSFISFFGPSPFNVQQSCTKRHSSSFVNIAICLPMGWIQLNAR